MKFDFFFCFVLAQRLPPPLNLVAKFNIIPKHFSSCSYFQLCFTGAGQKAILQFYFFFFISTSLLYIPAQAWPANTSYLRQLGLLLCHTRAKHTHSHTCTGTHCCCCSPCPITLHKSNRLALQIMISPFLSKPPAFSVHMHVLFLRSTPPQDISSPSSSSSFCSGCPVFPRLLLRVWTSPLPISFSRPRLPLLPPRSRRY